MFFLPPIQGYRNVLADLDELLHKSKKRTQLSSLGIFLSGCTKIPPQKPAFVIPLNTDQYEVVSQAMCQKWTTITGPPGTGKNTGSYQYDCILFVTRRADLYCC